MAPHPLERAYTFRSGGQIIDLDAIVAGLDAGLSARLPRGRRKTRR